MATIYKNADTPRLSGVQIKAPMLLDNGGRLQTAAALPFTHILKPAGTGGFEYLPLVEFISLALGKKIGFQSPEFALTEMPDGMQPALIVERFDIRQSADDIRMIALEDFCSLLDMTAADKYNGTIEQAARALRGISTAPTEDLLTLLKRALFAWLIADGDMHLKNIAVLKVTLPDKNSFQSIRMAPIYDLVSTVVFPTLKNDTMAIKLNGKANRIKRKDFMTLAATMGLKAADAGNLVDETVVRMAEAIPKMLLPGESIILIRQYRSSKRCWRFAESVFRNFYNRSVLLRNRKYQTFRGSLFVAVPSKNHRVFIISISLPGSLKTEPFIIQKLFFSIKRNLEFYSGKLRKSAFEAPTGFHSHARPAVEKDWFPYYKSI